MTAAGGAAEWLVEPTHPDLTRPVATRVNDARWPDRLTWNTFRLLAEWETDVWVPSLLEAACGDVNPLSSREWSGAAVNVWGTELDLTDNADVALDGVECFVVVETSFRDDLPLDHLTAGLTRALDVAQADARQAGYVVVTPTSQPDFGPLLDPEGLTGILSDRPGLDPGAVSRAIGWVTWRDLGALVLDLAEEADPLRAEQAHRLVTELQETFPGIEQ